jgi:hypothetical protein
MVIHIVFTIIHCHHFTTQIYHIAQLDHDAASLSVPLLLPSLDPLTFRTTSTKSRSADEEGGLKTNGQVSESFNIGSYYKGNN